MVVSHDRWFLDRIATHVLAFEGDSQVRWFEGNFEAYESFRHEQLGAEADRPSGSRTRSSYGASAIEPGPKAGYAPSDSPASSGDSSASSATASAARVMRAVRPLVTAKHRTSSARAQAMSRGVSPITSVCSRGYG